MKLTEQQITTAVEWWAKAIENPKFDMFGSTRKAERRAGGAGGEVAELMATMASAKDKPERVGKLDKFKRSLRRRLESVKEGGYFLGLFVDYGPEGMLWDAADDAGLMTGSPSTNFPWKTKMWFQNGGVQVACGYGAESEEIMLTKQ